MIPENTTTEVIATVIDENNNVLENARVKMFKFSAANNAYELQTVIDTNFEGEVLLHITLDTELYKFIIEYPIGTSVKETEGDYIYKTAINLPVSLIESFGDTPINLGKIETNLTYDESNDWFRWYWNDANGLASSPCLYVYKVYGGTEILYNYSCTTGATGILYVTAPEENGTTYRADGYLNVDGSNTIVDQLYKSYPEQSLKGKNSLFWCIVLCIIFSLIGFSLGSVYLGVLLFPLPFIIFRALLLIELSWGVVIGLEILALIISYILTR